jgi:uncharacterized membrane protein YccC
MTVVIVLKPNFGGTLQRAVQRITGTVLGALVAAVLLLVLTNPWLLVVAALAVLAFATFALRNRNYTLFSLALTPMIMLMLDIAHPISVTDSFLRSLCTIIGSFLALLSGYLLFPMCAFRFILPKRFEPKQYFSVRSVTRCAGKKSVRFPNTVGMLQWRYQMRSRSANVF